MSLSNLVGSFLKNVLSQEYAVLQSTPVQGEEIVGQFQISRLFSRQRANSAQVSAIASECKITVGIPLSRCLPYRAGRALIAHPVLISDEWRAKRSAG